MTWMETYSPADLRRDTERAMRVPFGLANPLWLAFGAAASAGLAFWWMTRLSRPLNIEARKAPVRAPAPVPAPAPAPAVATPAEPDDFTRIKGVGPRIAAALAEHGVKTLAQLAAWTDADLVAFDAVLNLRGRGHRDDWIGQAKALIAA